MKNHYEFGLTTLLASLLSLCFAGCGNKAPPEPFYIGHVASDNGPARDAILLAVEEANGAEDKIAGRPVAVLHPDVKNDAEADRTAIRLLTINRVVALLAGTGPAATEQLSRTAQQYNVPLMAAASPVNGTLPPNGFSVDLSPVDRGKTVARFLANLKKPSTAILRDNRAAVNAGIAAAFAEAYRGAGGKVEQEAEYADEKELAGRIVELQKVQAGAVVFIGPAGDLAVVQAAQSEVPLLWAGDETASHVLVPSGRTAPVYRVTAFAIDPGLPRTKEFAEKYQGRFQRSPSPATALAYDSARVLFDAMRRAGGFQDAKVREELRDTKDFESVTGPLSFDKAQNARRPAFVVRLENGKEKLEKRYDPE